MVKEENFPQSLLEQSIDDRLAYFEGITIAHPKLKEANQKLMASIMEPCGSPIILVYGPSGVGKSTLCKRVSQRIIESSKKNLVEDKGHIPVVSTEIIVPSFGKFDWKDYYIRCLQMLKDPACERRNINLFDYPMIQKDHRSESELRRTLENCCVYRDPKAFLIDEAQHLSMIASGRKLGDQINYIKSLASTTKVIHVLFGTYELLPFRNLSGQLSRRSIDVHFPRYQADNDNDAKEFCQVIYTFQKKMPLQEEPNLIEHWEYLYERSVGCVGTLKLWLNKSLQMALDEGAKTVTIKHLEEKCLSVNQCEKMITDILEGEMKLEEREESRERLLMMLGLKDTSSANNEGNKRKSHKRDVGLRNPVRDVVGR